MQSILGTVLKLEDVQNELSNAFGAVFDCQTRKVNAIDLMTEISGLETQRQELIKGLS
jgi:hypothetical protein